jgi:hypothetical protein
MVKGTKELEYINYVKNVSQLKRLREEDMRGAPTKSVTCRICLFGDNSLFIQANK